VLAEALLEYETIDGAEIDVLFAGGKLDRSPTASPSVAGKDGGEQKQVRPGQRSGLFPRPLPDPKRHSRVGWHSLVSMATRIVGVLNVTPDSFSDGGPIFFGGGCWSPQVWPWWRVARIGSTWAENPPGQGPCRCPRSRRSRAWRP